MLILLQDSIFNPQRCDLFPQLRHLTFHLLMVVPEFIYP